MVKDRGIIPTGKDLPSVLLGYQQRTLSIVDSSQVIFIEKSRRIGLTWGISSLAVLTAAASKSARGMDAYYIGFNLDMTKEFIDTSAEWAKAFSYAASDVEEYVFKDIDENGNTKDIQAFRIRFDSGFCINALTSRPRSLRGRQGIVIIDEAAFHDDLKELMKAALAFLIWGGKVVVISTHDGVANPFNEYIQAARAGRNNYKVIRITFDDALKDGLYKRICLVSGKEWSQDAEDTWRQEIVDFYGDGADEELFCIPRLSSGTFLPAVLVESRMQPDIPVIRYKQTDEFVHLPEHERDDIIKVWCVQNLKPLLDNLDPTLSSYIGGDFARSGDLSINWPIQVEQGLVRRPPFVLELRNIPFTSQRQILWYIIDRLPRFAAGAFDARGNGQQIAEETMQRYGAGRIHCVMTSAKWYLDALPKYKSGLEDGTQILPRDSDILNDHRLAVMVSGIPQIPDARTKGADGNKRHGDSLVAGAMAYWASLQDVVEYGYDTPLNQSSHSPLSRSDDDDIDSEYAAGRFGSRKGAF